MGRSTALLFLGGVLSVSGTSAPLRPPCVPLNVVSPYQSTWSCTDHLFDASPQHWTGANIDMLGLLKVDGEVFRFMGSQFASEKAMHQKSVEVAPTTTVYKFEAAGVGLDVLFTTPAIGLDSDIVLASRPITHVTFNMHSTAQHHVELYFDSSGEGSVQSNNETVEWSRPSNAPSPPESTLQVLQIGTVAQKSLDQGSDRIDWGYGLLATPKDVPGLHTVMQGASQSRGAFAKGSFFQLKDDMSGPRGAQENMPVLSMAWSLVLGPSKNEQRNIIMAYDQVESLRYFGTVMAPLWRQQWPTALAMLEAAQIAREKDLVDSQAFDVSLLVNLTAAGGDEYAALASLAYRQTTGGTQEVWNPVLKEPWVFMKEISSDGDVSTVDVVYPAYPMFQYLYPEYFRRALVPLLVYGNNGTKAYGLDIPYNLPWAPHHLGHWPVGDLPANKQEQMPVEESGNMLIMLSGLYKTQQSLQYLEPFWTLLITWADYIVASLPDPGDQLCTDDFEGPSPHNTNLAAKGIVALEAFAGLLDAKGDKTHADTYRGHAFAFAKNWTSMAADGDHYRIQFNLPNTWSLKYNIVWQKVLGLHAFPKAVIAAENKYYASKVLVCGVPLDDRHPYTKSDWSLWAASLADSQEQFEAIASRVFKFANTTPDRVPLSDWYDVTTCKMKGFRARPVQGGLFMKMLVPPLSQRVTEVIV